MFARPRRTARRFFLVVVTVLVASLVSPAASHAAGAEDGGWLGCHMENLIVTCRNPDGSTRNIEPGIGFAPGVGNLLNGASTMTVGGAATATRTAAGQAASSACGGGGCFLTGLRSLLSIGLKQTLVQPLQDNTASLEPHPGVDANATAKCAELVITSTLPAPAGSLAWNAHWLNDGAGQCIAQASVHQYATDSNGVMRYCVGGIQRTFYNNPTYFESSGTQGFGGCGGDWQVHYIEVTNDVAPLANYYPGNGFANVPRTYGALPANYPREYRTSLTCKSSTWGDLPPVVTTNLGGPLTGVCAGSSNGGEQIVPWSVKIELRPTAEAPWQFVDEYLLSPQPTADEVLARPNCYVARFYGYENVCGWQIELDGEGCGLFQLGDCFDWAELKETQPERVRCMNGPYEMPLAKCNFLEGAYKGLEVPLTGPNADGNPATWDGAKPQLDPATSPYPTATPTVTTSPQPTGTPTSTPTSTVTPSASQSPDPSSSPSASPTGGTGTGPTPGGAGQPAPGSEQSFSECFPNGWGVFNPAEWVLKPVKCALLWAFVPGDIGAKVTDWWDVNKGNLGGTPLGRWWTSFGAWGTAFSGASGPIGCQGPGVPMGFMAGHGVPATIYPFEACSGPKRAAASIVNGLLTVSIGFFSGWRIVRIVGKPFGYDLDLMNGRGEGK